LREHWTQVLRNRKEQKDNIYCGERNGDSRSLHVAASDRTMRPLQPAATLGKKLDELEADLSHVTASLGCNSNVEFGADRTSQQHGCVARGKRGRLLSTDREDPVARLDSCCVGGCSGYDCRCR